MWIWIALQYDADIRKRKQTIVILLYEIVLPDKQKDIKLRRMAPGRPNKLIRKIRRRRKLKLGLVGSSQVRYYPVDTLKNENLEPIILSTDPKNAKEIIETGKLDEIISTTIDQHQDMDAVFIFVGGNDVK